jgi:hypothetical protein
MKFFNKKEQVIDLQLTQYGKHLLSTGKFKPVYYAFFDDGIIYDPNYAYGPQEQKDIQKRIKTDTPQLEGQYNFRGVESAVRKVNKDIRSQDQWRTKVFEDRTLGPPDTMTDKQYALQSIIGTSDLNARYAPAWDIKLLKGRISSSAEVTSWIKDDTGNTIHIPQITPTDIVYKTLIKKVTAGEVLTGSRTDVYGNEYISVYTSNQGLLFDIGEKNSEFGSENFEIEVYEVEEESICDGKGGTRENLIPLYFTKQAEQIKDGILQDPESYLTQLDQGSNTLVDPSYVEYFLEIETDHEIDKDLLCEHTVDRSTAVYGTRFLDCEESDRQREIDSRNIYNTDVTEEDVEGC